MKAYGVSEDRIVGGAKWVDDNRYDIDAKPDHPVGDDEFKFMLRSLLADRFMLTVHREVRNVSGYALIVAKGGVRAKLAPPDTPEDATNTTSGGIGRLNAKATSMQYLATRLTDVLNAPVVDATRLDGYFDFDLKWTPDDATGASIDVSEGPSFFTALQQQLGLKLEGRKVPTDILVLDHVALPAEN
jgi:uncharacterized protein (TIGR03435 family)